jgi:glycosyltransferase involved in cell wall biosynthesis
MPEKNPRVTVILNIRNGAATLRETLASVVAQTEVDREILVWDDGSTDDSPAIVAEFAAHRLRYFRGQGIGLGPARNLALREARGDWVAFVDQDDLWSPTKLASQLALGDADPAVALVYGRTVAFTPDGRERDYDHRHEYQPLPEGDIFERLWIDSCFIAISSTLMRRSAVVELGGIPPDFMVSPDYFLYLGLARRHRVRAVQEVVCRYRLHANNMSHAVQGRIQREVLRLIDLWEHDLDPRLARHRRRVHSTVLAVQELRRRESALQGLRRLLTEGSVGFLVSRPLAIAWRGWRRRIQAPYWVRQA